MPYLCLDACIRLVQHSDSYFTQLDQPAVAAERTGGLGSLHAHKVGTSQQFTRRRCADGVWDGNVESAQSGVGMAISGSTSSSRRSRWCSSLPLFGTVVPAACPISDRATIEEGGTVPARRDTLQTALRALLRRSGFRPERLSGGSCRIVAAERGRQFSLPWPLLLSPAQRGR